MTEHEMLQAGIAALKSGDQQKASSIFAQLVKQYPGSEGGWYMLGMTIANNEQKKFCFQRVLSINPNNLDAKKQLAPLTQPEPAPPLPSWATQPPPFYPESEQSSLQSVNERPTIPPQPDTQERQRVPVFVDYDQEFEEFDEEPQKEPETPAKAPAKKKNNNIIFISVIAGAFILACTVLAGLAMFTSTFGSPIYQSVPNTATLPPFTPTLPTATSTPTGPALLPTAMPTLAYTPQFEQSPCQFDAPFGVNVTCGYAIVPENRTTDTGRTLRLAVAVFHSTSSSPAPDPIVFLQGGPGGEAVQLSADAFTILVQPYLDERDYVTFDQRGTGLSEPVMNCDELDKVFRQDIYGTLDLASRELVYQNAFNDCSALLQAKSIDLTAYSTVESAADLRDIVRLLGYGQVNLYGASYGTRLALVTMRNHPEIVRSAILDSVVPVEANVLEDYPVSVHAALAQLFITCGSQPKCREAYPDLEQVLWDTVHKLDAEPITLSTSAYPLGTVTETVDGSYLLSVTMALVRNAGFIESAPQTVYRVRDGDYSTLLAAQYSLPYAFDGISPGLYISMICREHALAAAETDLQNISELVGVKEDVFRPFYGDFSDMYKACETWGAEGPDLGENDAVVSNIPSLVIEGSFDPATPPYMGKQVAANLANSFYFEFPNLGHVPTAGDQTGCATKVVSDFMRNPTIEPDRACMNELPKVELLVPYTGTPPLELENQRVYGVNVNVPKDWFSFGDGFFVRGSSPFDITQVTAFRADISVQDLVDYFSSSINGYRGFDGAPVMAGTHEANGYLWNLYQATSNNRPVDVAAVDDGGSSIVIVMFSHPDEHEALYRTVFLPMVDSAK